MSSDDSLKRVSGSNAFGDDRGARQSDRDTAVYVEDGWIFRVKPGAPIECMRATSRAETLPPVDHRDPRP
jgi:hypothetical protein